MNALTNHAQRTFQITAGGLERIGVDGQGRTEYHEGCTVFGTADGLFKRESTHGLYGYFYSIHYFP